MSFSSTQLATASLTSQLGGLASGAVGSFFSAQTAKINAENQAVLADTRAYLSNTNARIAELGAQSALQQGEKQVGALTLKAAQLKGSQRARLAANGVDLGTGNAAEILAGTDVMTEIDKNTINANAVRTAWGYRTQATNYQAEAGGYEAQANMQRAKGNSISAFGAASSSLLGNAGSVASSWYALNKSGALAGTVFEVK